MGGYRREPRGLQRPAGHRPVYLRLRVYTGCPVKQACNIQPLPPRARLTLICVPSLRGPLQPAAAHTSVDLCKHKQVCF